MRCVSVSISQLLSFSFSDAFQLDDGVVKTQCVGLPLDLTPGWRVTSESLNSFELFISHLLPLVAQCNLFAGVFKWLQTRTFVINDSNAKAETILLGVLRFQSCFAVRKGAIRIDSAISITRESGLGFLSKS